MHQKVIKWHLDGLDDLDGIFDYWLDHSSDLRQCFCALYSKSMNRSLQVVFTIRPKIPRGSFYWCGKDGYLSVMCSRRDLI